MHEKKDRKRGMKADYITHSRGEMSSVAIILNTNMPSMKGC